MYKTTAVKRQRIMLRSMTVTLIIILLISVGLFCVGQAFEVMEKTAYNREVEAFGQIGYDKFVFFGKEYNIPLNTAVDEIKELYINFCSPIIKLLKTAVDSFKELISFSIRLSFS